MGRGWLLAACVCAATAWALTRRDDEWYHDAMTRSYAGDHFLPHAARRPDYPAAATIAARWYLPVGWVVELQDSGVKPTQLDQAAARVHNKFLSLGPPRSTDGGELAERKRAALSAGVAYG